MNWNRVEINGNRWYDIDGKKYISVTTALSHLVDDDFKNFMLEMQSKGQFDAVMKNAGDTGTQVHQCIENHQKGIELPEVNEKANNAFCNYLAAEVRHTIQKPKYSEVTVYSKKYGYAGTMDYVGVIDGQLTVCDWKSGKFSFKNGFQVAAYRMAAIEMGLIDYDCGSSILYIGKHGEYFKLYTHKQHEFLFEQFLCAMFNHQGLYPGIYRGLEKQGEYDLAWKNPFKTYYGIVDDPKPEDFGINDVEQENNHQNGVVGNI
ncbi:MAG: hypothetical protein KDK51_10750 [Deltaproteobacteria bacterium]|nr:hypothetical protein [Deltaproteobacteria bacterium]